IGRSGHALGAVPKGRLFPLTRDQLVECAALVRAARRGVIDHIAMRVAPLDVLAQQIVAARAAPDWDPDPLFPPSPPPPPHPPPPRPISRARISTRWWACPRRASPPGAAGRGRDCPGTPCTAGSRAGAAPASPH